MTRNSDAKSLVRARMSETGENYTQAQAALYAQRDGHVAEAHRIRDKTLRSFFAGSRLTSIPARRRARVVILLHLLDRFEVGRTYLETQVNALLREAFDDVASLRRELVDYQFLEREAGVYWVNTVRPQRSVSEAQETALLEDAWWQHVRESAQ